MCRGLFRAATATCKYVKSGLVTDEFCAVPCGCYTQVLAVENVASVIFLVLVQCEKTNSFGFTCACRGRVRARSSSSMESFSSDLDGTGYLL